MQTGGLIMGALYLIGLSVTAPVPPTQVPQDGFTLAGVIPNDAFLYVAERHNPERQFLDDYWREVFGALAESGVGQDALELIGSLLGAKPAGEAERLKERAAQLLAGLDWNQLAGREFVFAEQFVPEAPLSPSRPTFGMAAMVWLFRGSPAGAAQNYAGLVAILEAVAEEINRAAGSPALAVTRTEQMGTQVASVNLLAIVPGAPELPLSVGLRKDVVIVALREHLLGDVLALMEGKSPKKALGVDPRFQAAFAQLPPAEDSMTFFDMQALLKPLRAWLSSVVDMARAPGDIYRNTELTAEGNRLNAQALSAYQRGDVKEALALIEKLYDSAPQNAIVLYNRACFNALLGNQDAALSWLEKAVDGGFYAPTKIATDRDLDSLRGEARYKAALAKASELAATQRAEDVVINSTKTGEAYALTMQAWQAYEVKDYEQGLKLVEQAYAVAPKDSRVLYSLACFHALLGHKDKALEFLGAAVAGGFYCPRHIAKDPDLDSLRSDERYQAALTLAREKAAQLASQKTGAQIAWVRLALDKLADAVGILDYVAAVESTDGYAIWTESVTTLVPDAKSKPVYPVFAGKKPLTEFDRYLPQETVSFSVSSGFSPRALYQFLEDSVRELGPPGEELLVKWAELQKQIGVNVQQDIVDWIDGGFVSVDLSGDRGSVWLLKVTDDQVAREKVGAAIKFFSTKLPEVVGKSPALAPLALMSSVYTSPLEREDLRGFENLHFAMLPQPAVWGVAEGYLVVATSADAAALCLATARGDHPGIRKNARVMAEAIIPDGPFASVSLTDERGFGEGLAKGIGMVSMISGMMGSFVPEPRLRSIIAKVTGILTKLTPVVRKIDFYKSTASLTTFDGQKWCTRKVTHYLSPAERTPRSTDQAAVGTAPSR
jgi:tetratricopeptide (TPR) repeat protein